ncbi:MAG: hypothetical protein PHR16_14100 [Methylovulum sp.]|nr:hypothetical protein [Methylovulum sp.]
MAALSFSTALRNARAQTVIDSINAGVGAGALLFYDAPRPSVGAAITTQTLLGTLGFAEPAGAVADGLLTFDPLTDDSSADATGDAAWCRVLDGDGIFVMDMDVTDNAGAGPVKMPSITVYAGGVIHITSASIAEGNA